MSSTSRSNALASTSQDTLDPQSSPAKRRRVTQAPDALASAPSTSSALFPSTAVVAEHDDHPEETSDMDVIPAPLSAKAKGKRKASGTSKPKPAPKSRTPARQSRSISVATSVSGDGNEEQVKPKGKRAKKPLKKLTKKSTVLPPAPALFQLKEPNERELEEQKKEIQRGMDPTLAKELQTSLVKQKDIYKSAYEALEDELVRVQIEASVFRNIKTIVRSERDRLRPQGLSG